MCGNLDGPIQSKTDSPSLKDTVCFNLEIHVTPGIKVAWICYPLANKLFSLFAVIQYAPKANCIDPSCESWLSKRVESKPCCAAHFSLLRGDCNPGDASANGRKPEPDTGIKVGAAG